MIILYLKHSFFINQVLFIIILLIDALVFDVFKVPNYLNISYSFQILIIFMIHSRLFYFTLSKTLLSLKFIDGVFKS